MRVFITFNNDFKDDVENILRNFDTNMRGIAGTNVGRDNYRTTSYEINYDNNSEVADALYSLEGVKEVKFSWG